MAGWRPAETVYVYQGERMEYKETEALLGRVLALPEREQLRIHAALSDVLGGRLGRETQRALEAQAS